MSFETVINQNDETVALINVQDFSRAIVSSLSALRCHRSLVANSKSNLFASNGDDDCLDQYILEGNIDVATQPTRRSFIYSQGIRIPRDGSTDETAIAAVLLFNTGLAYQLLAQKRTQSAPRLLHKARTMYILTYKTQKNCHDNVLFLFAVRNNLAVIEQHMGITRASYVKDSYLEYLKCVNRIVDHGCHFRLAHLESFWRNLPSTADTAPSA